MVTRSREDVGRRDALKRMASAAAALAPAGKAAGADARGRPDAAAAPVRREMSFDDGWRFHRGDVAGAERAEFDDSRWRLLDVPHDWSVEPVPDSADAAEGAIWNGFPGRVGPFDRNRSPGKMSTGWTVGGAGWYRKRFTLDALPRGGRVEVRFGGIYYESDVWLNGQRLGTRPFGYTGFAYDLTAHLRRGAVNVLAVRARNEGRNSRWYSGSGIYRHVSLAITGGVRIPMWGIHPATVEASADRATVQLTVTIENATDTPSDVTARMRVAAPDGRMAEASATASLGARAATQVTQAISLRAPALWSPANPRMYRVEVELLAGGRVVDRSGTPFGIRTIEVDAIRGLRINGEPLKLKGACVHHDNGVLGAAAIDRAEHRRVELLKANGFNAIRCSHNPPSPAFLDACDRLGMLVIDEAFDMWQLAKNPEDYHRHFDEWCERDLESMILRDRHHPSVLFWSIGNEIKERADPQGVATGGKLRALVRRLDPTRPVTAGICGFWEFREKRAWEQSDAAFAYLDVGGYNYEWRHYEQDHARHPARVMAGTESFPAEAFESWRAAQKLPYVLGDFVWTGMDYLGESGIGHSYLEGDKQESLKPYPWFNGYCGDIDLIGGKKPQSYYRDVLWGISRLEMAVQRPVPEGRTEKLSKWGWSDELRSWTWPGAEGRLLKVRVYSCASEVRLLLNGREVGRRAVSEETRLTAEFEVPYQPGELRAIAVERGKEIGELTFKTAGRPASIRLRADRTIIAASRNDLAYVTAEVLDEAGDSAPDAMVTVAFTVEGSGELAASGNANPQDMGSFRQPRCRTFHGRCLAVIRPAGPKGEVRVRASAAGLKPGAATILVR